VLTPESVSFKPPSQSQSHSDTPPAESGAFILSEPFVPSSVSPRQLVDQQPLHHEAYEQKANMNGATTGYADHGGMQHVQQNPYNAPMGHPSDYSQRRRAPEKRVDYLYPAQLPSTEMVPENPKKSSSFFINDRLKHDLINRSVLIQEQPSPATSSSTPQGVHTYHSLVPLEDLSAAHDSPIKMFGHALSTYKATNAVDGMAYVLRRLEGFRLVNEKAMAVVERIKQIPHPNIINLREVFTTKDFGDHSLVFVYDYHPGAVTLQQHHFARHKEERIEERVLWSYVIQLSSALRVMHNQGLACRVVHPSKILVTGKNRLRFNCVGVFDMITFDSANQNHSQMVSRYQQDDLISFGRVIVALACGSLIVLQKDHLQSSLDFIARNYSQDLITLVLYLFSQPNAQHMKSVNDLMPFIGARFYHEVDQSKLHADRLEHELSKEMDNGRLLRLVVKLGFINERPEYMGDPQWSETGDRYLLRLFRNYVFHQVDDIGRPLLDLGHVVQTLNKMDAGVQERIQLMSADGQTLLVVSYGDLKRCLIQVIQELKSSSGIAK